MSWNNGHRRKQFEEKQKKQAEEYRVLGMTEEQIQAMYEFDLEQFKSDRNYYSHTQPLSASDFDEGKEDESESTLFLKFFGNENWLYLVLFIGVLPLTAAVMFKISPFPDMSEEASQKKNKEKNKNRTIGLALCVGCIFLGSCAENTMSNWISTYMENALNIDKALGDILGMAMFAILLGITRITYAKYGKNISKFLLVSMICAAICYLTVSFSNNTIISFVGCILTGIFTSMLWPGTLILMEEKVKGVGVAAYALMASAGDFGASLAPQLMGIVIDNVSVSKFALNLSATLNLTPEQIGLKTGMLITSIFPILGTILMVFIIKYFKKQKAQEN
jgi:fucose permease